jgi:bifunctional ADP-heptose synthase (sugar kinase/adenylyltransferase)
VLLPSAAALFQNAGGIAIFFVLQKPADQLLPGIVDLFVDFIAARQDLVRLDFDKRAGQGQEIAHRVYVELLDYRDILQILIGDFGNGDVDNLHLVLSYQVQEQIQRSAEQVQIDAKIHGQTIFILPALVKSYKI